MYREVRTLPQPSESAPTIFLSIFALISRASVKKASSTLMEALALVSMNLMPCSMASCTQKDEKISHFNLYYTHSIYFCKYTINVSLLKTQQCRFKVWCKTNILYLKWGTDDSHTYWILRQWDIHMLVSRKVFYLSFTYKTSSLLCELILVIKS